MRCSLSLLLRSAMFLFALTTFCAVSAFPQDPPSVAMGMSPSATYHGGDFDSVDMATGRLHLQIPVIADHSQRGNLNFTYTVTFTSNGIWTGVAQPPQYIIWLIEPPKYGISGPTLVPEGSLNSSMWVDVYNDGTDRYYAYSVFEDGAGNGTKHPMGLITGNQNSGSSTWESIDGSGIYAPKNIAGAAVETKEGLGYTSSSITDPNGNVITLGGSQLTDTLGRAWTSTFNSTNVSGCPTGGPVAPSSATIWTVPGPTNINNGSRSLKFCYSTYNIQTNFSSPGYTFRQYSGLVGLMTGIVLPDGTTWRFDYDNYSYADLTDVYTPTGGHYSYTWTSTNGCGGGGGTAFMRGVNTRTVNDGASSNQWTYTWGSPASKVTDPLNNDTVYSPYSVQGNSCSGIIGQIDYYSGPSGGSAAPVKTVKNSYLDLPDPFPADLNQLGVPDPQLLTGVTTIWANGQQSQVQWTYDSGFTFYDDNPGIGQSSYPSKYGLKITESHSDYANGAPGPVLSKTNTTYKYSSDSRYLTANILDLPSSVVTTDSNSTPNVCAETDYGYDEFTADPSGVTEQHVSAPNSVSGNLTSITRQLFTNPCSSPTPSKTPLKATKHVYDTGMVHTSTDPNSNTTTYAYSSNFYGAYVTQTTFPNTSSPNPANHIISGNYDFKSGLLASFTDQNNNTTNFTYDVMLRPTNVTYPSPDGGQTNFIYANTTTVEMQKLISGTTWTDSFVYYDGLGRKSRSMSKNDETLPWDQVDTCYDADGRVVFTTYPYQGQGTSTAKACSNSAEPGDTFAYDPLNRVTQVTHSDNSTVLTSYAGRATSVQDEGNGTTRVQRISQVDGMGQLTSVCEVSGTSALGSGGTPAACNLDIGGTGFLTTYTYNPLGDLTSVSQGGYLPRSFTYDSLSRLVTSTNPEAGTITYKYEIDINCSQPNSFAALLVSRVDARGIRTCMRYDALNRVTQKNYSDGTPTATFNFDEISAFGVSLANTTGRPSSDATASPNPTGEVFSYDKLGRVRINSQCTPQNCGALSVFPINYTYDLLGDTLTATNGMGVTFTYPPYNRALRIMGMTSSLSDSNHPGTLYSSPHYNAAGSVTSASIGNSGSSVNETRSYDGRLRLASITDGSVYSVSILSSGGYAPDSDILQAIDSANTTWSYSYDAMNRLCNANHSATFPTCHSSATITYGYDRFGNMWQGDGGLSISFSGNNNHIDGLASHYDAAGNLMYDGATNYTYDSESRIISTSNTVTGVIASYLYDTDGRRIRKTTSNGGTVDFLYDLGGHEITQVTSAGSWTRGEIYAGGRHLGTYSGGTSGTTTFTFSDWLGTERARSAPGATTACETITSLPFGDGLTTTGSCGDPSPMHFTGKERDSESGLDNFGARYNSSQYGRFMTPDSAGKQSAIISNPQTWNKYTYVLNNPLRLVDPSGRFPTDAHIYWGEIALGHVGFTGDAARLSRVSNTILDHGYFNADRLHALAGDAAFRAAKSQLFSMALDSKRSDGERGLAVMAGMHLVEDYQAHKGLVGFPDHLKKYHTPPSFDANPDSKEGRQALADALHFVDGVKGALSNSLGDEAGQAKLNEMLNAAENLLNTDMVWGAMSDISQGLYQNAADNTERAPHSSPMLLEEENRQCRLGNRAACD